MEIRPNPGCPNPLCGRLQAAYEAQYNSEAAVSARAASAAAVAEAAKEEVVHDENSWGISVVPEEANANPDVPTQSTSGRGALAEGIEYSMPVSIARHAFFCRAPFHSRCVLPMKACRWPAATSALQMIAILPYSKLHTLDYVQYTRHVLDSSAFNVACLKLDYGWSSCR